MSRTGSFVNFVLLMLPSSTASTHALVALIDMRFPTPYPPPVHPVLMRKHWVPCLSSFSWSRSAYLCRVTPGWMIDRKVGLSVNFTILRKEIRLENSSLGTVQEKLFLPTIIILTYSIKGRHDGRSKTEMMGDQSGHNLHSRVERKEGSSKASGEVGSRLRHSALRARHLGRVAAEEVVHRLSQQKVEPRHKKRLQTRKQTTGGYFINTKRHILYPGC